MMTFVPLPEVMGRTVQVIPLSATWRTIGRRLTEAKQSIPHFYLTAEYDIDGLRPTGPGSTRATVPRSRSMTCWCGVSARP